MSKDGQDSTGKALSFMRVTTRQLRLIVAQHKKSFPEDRFVEFIRNIRKVFDQYSSRLAEFEPGMDRAMVAHVLVNQSIQQSPEFKSTCGRGCSACCHFEVEVTTDEGKLLAGLVQDGVEIDRKRLAVQAARKRLSPEWTKPFKESSRCVFLGPDQACRIYDFRPLSCRKHLVSTPPSDCAKGTDEPILLPLAEIAVSAALSQPGNMSSSISKILSPLLEKKGEKKLGKKKKPDLTPEVEA